MAVEQYASWTSFKQKARGRKVIFLVERFEIFAGIARQLVVGLCTSQLTQYQHFLRQTLILGRCKNTLKPSIFEQIPPHL